MSEDSDPPSPNLLGVNPLGASVLRAALRALIGACTLGVLGLLSGEPLQAWIAFTLVVAALGPAALLEAGALRLRTSPLAVIGFALATLGVSWVALAGAQVQSAYLLSRWGRGQGVQDAWLGGVIAWEDVFPFGFFALALTGGLVVRVFLALRADGLETLRRVAPRLLPPLLLGWVAIVSALAFAAGRPYVVGVVFVLVAGCLPAAGALAAYYVVVDRLAERLEGWRTRT